ncbi:hypothetical protein A0H81_08876 [Grifola frondosa]|uniref:DUF6533 domain-containing protein n=1 Tax=Grifola frondosa TaxID=5627 RepID=A0A1C7M9I7_GRIFR|nr:hypothetical protein A0H81_08876 [Grifola frondosa]
MSLSCRHVSQLNCRTSLIFIMADTIAGIISQELFLFKQAAHDAFVVNICTVAVTAWLAYDILLTIGQEVDLIWRAKLSPAKILYFLVRYYNLLSLILLCAVNTSTKISFDLYSVPLICGAVFVCAVLGEALLLLRLYAAYERSRKAFAFILLLFIGESTISLVGLTLQVKGVRITPRLPNFPIPGCVGTADPGGQISVKSWITVMCVACVNFLMILYKFFRGISFKDIPTSASDTKFKDFLRLSPLMALFVRDAAFYFFVIFAANLLNLLCAIYFANRGLEQVGSVWLTAVSAVVSSRICLNLRGFIALPCLTSTGTRITALARVAEYPLEFSSA